MNTPLTTRRTTTATNKGDKTLLVLDRTPRPQTHTPTGGSKQAEAAKAMALSLNTPFLPTVSMKPSSAKLPLPAQVGGGRWVCRKQGGVHPEFYEDAKVYCNGELVMTTGGTRKEYAVDVWSGNHPFYLGSRSALAVEDDQVEKFRKKYGELSSLMEIPVLKHGEIVLPQRKKGSAKGKGKK
ncbi:unnamed protein product [Musa hybrid cultivar]